MHDTHCMAEEHAIRRARSSVGALITASPCGSAAHLVQHVHALPVHCERGDGHGNASCRRLRAGPKDHSHICKSLRNTMYVGCLHAATCSCSCSLHLQRPWLNSMNPQCFELDGHANSTPRANRTASATYAHMQLAMCTPFRIRWSQRQHGDKRGAGRPRTQCYLQAHRAAAAHLAVLHACMEGVTGRPICATMPSC